MYMSAQRSDMFYVGGGVFFLRGVGDVFLSSESEPQPKITQ